MSLFLDTPTQSLQPTIQQGGVIDMMNNGAGIFGPTFQFIVWTGCLLGLILAGKGVWELKKMGDENGGNNKASPKTVLLTMIAGAMLMSLPATAKMAVISMFGDGSQGGGVRVNSQTPFYEEQEILK